MQELDLGNGQRTVGLIDTRLGARMSIGFIEVSDEVLPAVRAFLLNWSHEAGAKMIRRAFRREMHQRDPHCAYCRRLVRFDNSTIDHVTPRCRGGSDAPSNLVLCCMPCNTLKGDQTLDEWREKLMQGLLFAGTKAEAHTTPAA